MTEDVLRLGDKLYLLNKPAHRSSSALRNTLDHFIDRAQRGRKWALSLESKLKVAVVFAMWNEGARLRPQSFDNPLGEDSLLNKCRELNWLFEGSKVEWIIYAIDDGCPQDSFGTAKHLLESSPWHEQVRVLKLKDALPSLQPPLTGLADVDASAKGGAIAYGCARAIEDGNDIVAYTDCDTSTCLAELGPMMHKIQQGEADLCVGSRIHPESATYVAQRSEFQGLSIVRAIQRSLCPPLYAHHLTDTQSPLKVFSSAALGNLNSDFDTYDFSFDIEYLLHAHAKGMRVHFEPCMYIYSAEGSTVISTGMGKIYAQIIRGTIKSARKWGVPVDEPLAGLLSISELEVLLESIWNKDPKDLHFEVAPGRVELPALRSWVQSLIEGLRSNTNPSTVHGSGSAQDVTDAFHVLDARK